MMTQNSQRREHLRLLGWLPVAAVTLAVLAAVTGLQEAAITVCRVLGPWLWIAAFAAAISVLVTAPRTRDDRSPYPGRRSQDPT
jgi:amino acid transporter